MKEEVLEKTEPKETDVLRAMVDAHNSLQKSRVAMGNRLFAIKEGNDTATDKHEMLLKHWEGRFEEMEEAVLEEIKELVKDEEIVQHMTAVKGVGLNLAAQLISSIDITRANTVSALWKYCGYAVVDGERDRPRKGEKLGYNQRMKVVCFKIGRQMLMISNSPYRQRYDDAKAYYETNRTGENWQDSEAGKEYYDRTSRLDWTKNQIHLASMRKMVKLFLSHLWIRWRTLEGLPVNKPYVHEKLGHDSVFAAEDFGWPDLEQGNNGNKP